MSVSKPLAWFKGLVGLVAVAGAVYIMIVSIQETIDPFRKMAKELRSGDLDLRIGAARNMSTVDASEIQKTVGPLTAAIGDTSEIVAYDAIKSLSDNLMKAMKAGDRKPTGGIVRALTVALKDSRPTIRTAALKGLSLAAEEDVLDVKPDGPWVGELTPLLNDQVSSVRAGAAEALGLIVGPSMIPPPAELTKAFTSDEDIVVRIAAARGLGEFEIGADETVLILMRGLNEEDNQLKAACAGSLRLIYSQPINKPRKVKLSLKPVPELLEYLKSVENEKVVHAARLLSLAGPNAKEAIGQLRALFETSENANVVYASATTLAKLFTGTDQASEIVKLFRAALASNNPTSKASAAIVALGYFSPQEAESAIEQLIALQDTLKDSGEEPASMIPKTLVQLTPKTKWAPRVIFLLEQSLKSQSVPLRMQSAGALGQFGAEASGSVPVLRELASTDTRNRVNVTAKEAADAIEEAVMKANEK